MRRTHWKLVALVILLGVMLCTAAYAKKDKEKRKRRASAGVAKAAQVVEEGERQVTETQVPGVALAALKKLAAVAEITEFAEEVEFGHTFYEGSWKSPSGANVDVLVTQTGDLVEIEEQVDADKVPAAVLKVAKKAAGKGTELAFEKKTMILYEAKFQKGNSPNELLLTPDGRRFDEKVAAGKGTTKRTTKRKTKGSEEDNEEDDDKDG